MIPNYQYRSILIINKISKWDWIIQRCKKSNLKIRMTIITRILNMIRISYRNILLS